MVLKILRHESKKVGDLEKIRGLVGREWVDKKGQ